MVKIGDRFNKLVIIAQEGSKIQQSQKCRTSRKLWICKCDCGNLRKTTSDKLKQNWHRECKNCEIKYCPNHIEKIKARKKSGICQKCYQSQYQKKNKKKLNKNQKIWRSNNPEKYFKYKENRKNKIKNDPETRLKSRSTDLKTKYGISQEDYTLIAKFQDNKCYLCLGSPNRKHLSIDHCHKTGKIRGLLCERCNMVTGTFDKNPKFLERLKQYMKSEFRWTKNIWEKQRLKGKLNGNK